MEHGEAALDLRTFLPVRARTGCHGSPWLWSAQGMQYVGGDTQCKQLPPPPPPAPPHARTHVRTNTSHRQAPTRRQRSAPASEATAAVRTASALPPNESLKRRVLSRPWSREIVKSSRHNLSALRRSTTNKQTNKHCGGRPCPKADGQTVLRCAEGAAVVCGSGHAHQCTNVRARTHTRARTHAANEQ
jgi:hypothetical protein